jgi:hypothetical protein
MKERDEILAAMADLNIFGMPAAYDELMATAVRRQHEPQGLVRGRSHHQSPWNIFPLISVCSPLLWKAHSNQTRALGVQSRHLVDWVEDESIRL